MERSLGPARSSHSLQEMAEVADMYARRDAFASYGEGKSEETLRRNAAAIDVFLAYLRDAGVDAGDLHTDPFAWAHMSHGIILGFKRWMYSRGYAIGTINVRLATVKRYCQLAFQSGCLPSDAYALIQSVKGYTYGDGIEADKKRDVQRIGKKKNVPVEFTKLQAARLKQQPDTDIGVRDALMMCLLLNHGFRCSELIDLRVSDIDMESGIITLWRRKVKKTQKHRMNNETLLAYERYLAVWHPDDLLFDIEGTGYTSSAVRKRVCYLGECVGITGLSPHDCRHHWATWAARNGTPAKVLQDAGGWNSPVIPMRYIASQEIANEGVIL